jgi:hypothetical protein
LEINGIGAEIDAPTVLATPLGTSDAVFVNGSDAASVLGELVVNHGGTELGRATEPVKRRKGQVRRVKRVHDGGNGGWIVRKELDVGCDAAT